MEKAKNIVIGGAWPYANSDLHLGDKYENASRKK